MTPLSPAFLDATDDRLPLHRRLADALSAAIKRGDFPPGQPLPSESEIARDCGVALGTVRQAMSSLREQGLIERRQGRGTFVRRADFAHSLLRFYRFGDVEPGRMPTGEVLSTRTQEADAATAASLQCRVGDRVLRLERLRQFAGEPVAWETIWLPLPRFAALADLRPDRYPDLLYPFYELRCDAVIVRALEDLTIAAATDRDCELLACGSSEPVVVIERVAFAVDETPLERRISRGAAATFHYRVEIS